MPDEERLHDLPLVALDAMPQQVAVLDRSGRILLVNEAWRRFIQEKEILVEGVGATVGDDYLSFLAEVSADATGDDGNRSELLGVQAVLAGAISGFSREYLRRTTDGERWFLLEVSPRRDGEGAVVVQTDVTDRLKTERVLRDSESRYRAIFSQMYAFLGVLSTDGRLVEVNDAPLVAGGYSRDEAIGKCLWDTPWWQGQNEEQAVLRADIAAAAAGNTIRREGPYFTADGERRTVDRTFTPIRNEAGEVNLLLASGLDVTERKQVEVALRESENKYRTLFALMDQGFCIVEMIFDDNGKPVDHRFLEVNPMFEQLTGMYGALGRTAREIVPDLEQHWFDVYGGVALSGNPVRFTQGSEVLGRWFDVYAFRLGGDESKKVALLFTNVTDRKRAEAERERLVKALELERSRLATVFHEAPAAITTLRGPEHVFEMANPLYYELVGRRDIIGKTVREAIPEVAGQGLFELLDRVYETGEPYEGRGVRVLLQRETDGETSERFLDLVYQPLREVDGSVSGIFVHAVDVTEHKQTAAELEKAQEELERRVEERTADLRALNAELEAFNYSVAHDLRTPLRGIDGFSQVLLEDYVDSLDETGQSYLARIRGAAERMGDLIDHLLDLSRLSTGTVKSEHVDLSRVARRAVDVLRTRDPERRVQVDIEDGMTVRGDRALLTIVIENLLDNSWKFSGRRDPARIEVRTLRIDGRKTFLIRDNGAGFDERYADRLFMAFQRLHSPHDFPGSGVGLAIVQRIVNRHGGRVWAESEVEKGATFYFTLADD